MKNGIMIKTDKWKEIADKLYDALGGLPYTEKSYKTFKMYEDAAGK